MRALLLLSASLLLGCAAGSPPDMDPSVVHADTQCPGEGAADTRWLRDASALDAYGAGSSATPPLLLVDMGQRPTAGYRLALPEASWSLVDAQATLRVEFIEPAPGMMLAQVLTRPCLLVALPTVGYRVLRVVDQHGREQARLDPP
jgi:hypothetical protein